MEQVFTVVEASDRLDSYLANELPELSRSQVQKYIEKNDITVNGRAAKSSQKLSAGDKIEIKIAKRLDFSQKTLPIIFENDDVIVINKPSGILTHSKGAANDEFTVAEFIRPRTTDGNETNRPGIVHRLDRGTSGVIIAAKNHSTKLWLQKQFSQRKVKKTYLALVKGTPKNASAILHLPIERNPKKPQTFRVGGNGKPAETAYKTLKNYDDYTLLELAPHTGRTHQLRVHMQYLGCPIVGDQFYGQPEPRLNRLFLHAYSLEITLPTKERTTFVAPLPDELEDFLRDL